MDVLKGRKLLRKNGEEVLAEEALANIDIIGLYFSAHWCPPCRMFTPVLADMYSALKESEEPFEVVFVSSDETEEAMLAYMNESHGDWLALPFTEDLVGENHESQAKYSVEGIPTLIVVKHDGTLVSPCGDTDVKLAGKEAFDSWKEGKQVYSAGDGDGDGDGDDE